MYISVSKSQTENTEMIMKHYKMILVALLGLILTACYNKFEEPAAPIVYTDDVFEALNPDLKHISIADLKAKFGTLAYTGTNKMEDSNKKEAYITKHIHFVGDPQTECTPDELKKNWYDTGNYYIKGKVISNDEQGNIYKSLHIFDGTAAIELKLTNGLYLGYPCNLDTKESMWVYVKLRGLYLANFRMMLSIGDIPTTSYNSWGDYKYYGNSNIVSQNKVRQHIFPGEKVLLTEGTADSNDILVVNSGSYNKLYGEAGAKYLGRLVRFENLRVCYAGAPNEAGPTDPIGDNVYPQWLCSAGIPASIGGSRTQVVQKPWYKMAYSVDGVSQYGSILVTYNSTTPTETNTAGVYTVRTSGYSRFANKFIPKDGTVGNVLAIFGLYATYWDYQYGTYQLSISRFEDFEFETVPTEEYKEWSDHIAWAEHNFPKYTLVPLTDDTVHAEEVAIWKAHYLANKPANDGSAAWGKWNEWGDWVVWCLENTTKDAWLLPQYLTEDEDGEQ